MVKVKEEDLSQILPDRDFALDFLRKLRVPYSVRRHSIKVADKALEIANKIKKTKVNMNLVEIGALLHDVGRSKTHGFNHALIGGKILRARGFPEELVRICETHILGGLDKEDAQSVGLPIKDYIPTTLEEKIICLADKLLAGRRPVSLKNRFAIWFNKYGKTNILMKAQQRVEKIQKEIEDLM
ncbi:MAG: HDIG domain-containing protein [Promethearchaeota archaeon]|nr:MAG: HDIG domain-containing protein [Candidatus Lokiarchaeota archaeon]